MKKENKNHWIKNIFKGELFDLGDEVGEENLKGILTPRYDNTLMGEYLTAQFTDKAYDYIARYDNSENKKTQILQIFKQTGLVQHKKLAILDLGSGGGSSVIALSSLCPESSIIASDLSIEMLVALKNAWENSRSNGVSECGFLRLNAESLNFENNSFNLIFGSAVLHHLISPEKTIAGCGKILKKGGMAIFFEPFEPGYGVLSTVYKRILENRQSETLPPEITNFFKAIILDWDVRKGQDKSGAIFKKIDDKWLFNKEYFFDLGRINGFSQCNIYRLYSIERMFELETERLLREGLKSRRDILPNWAWNIVRDYDSHFSEDCRKELLLECAVVFTKGAQNNRWKGLF